MKRYDNRVSYAEAKEVVITFEGGAKPGEGDGDLHIADSGGLTKDKVKLCFFEKGGEDEEGYRLLTTTAPFKINPRGQQLYRTVCTLNVYHSVKKTRDPRKLVSPEDIKVHLLDFKKYRDPLHRGRLYWYRDIKDTNHTILSFVEFRIKPEKVEPGFYWLQCVSQKSVGKAEHPNGVVRRRETWTQLLIEEAGKSVAEREKFFDDIEDELKHVKLPTKMSAAWLSEKDIKPLETFLAHAKAHGTPDQIMDKTKSSFFGPSSFQGGAPRFTGRQKVNRENFKKVYDHTLGLIDYIIRAKAGQVDISKIAHLDTNEINRRIEYLHNVLHHALEESGG
jgi:hypothetical protein